MKKILTFLFFVPLFLVLFCFFLYFFQKLSLKSISDFRETKFSSKFIETASGDVVCYNFHGKKESELIILIHGFSFPKEVFDKNIDSFVKSGYRVLTFDHLGRGCSDRPYKKYDEDFYKDEIINLITSLNIKKPFYLLGYSMGGGVATVFASHFPEKIKKLILVAPTGLMPEPRGQKRFLLIPGIGEFAMRFLGKDQIIDGIRNETNKNITNEKMFNSIKRQFDYKGTINALVSSYRYFINIDLTPYHKIIHENNIKVLAIWGSKDVDVPYESHYKFIESMPNIKMKSIKGAGHSVLYSHYELVNTEIKSFISSED
jgi:pimeloyl-ACP methyl ester carboxylesterase